MKKLKLDLTKEAFHDVLGISYERMLELSVLVNDIVSNDKTRNKIVNTEVMLREFKPKTEGEVLAMGMAIGRIFTLQELGIDKSQQPVRGE